QMISDLMYPVFLYHFAVFIMAFLQFIQSGPWLTVLLLGLVPIYAVVIFLIFAGQSRHGETWRAGIESMLNPVPVLGAARRSLALARLAAALEALISAGVSIVEAWELAASVSGSPALRRTVLTWRPLLRSGQTPSEIVGACAWFPQLFSGQYRTGEMSGKLDETLRRLHGYYQEEGSRKLHAVSQWVPRIIYLLVALIVAYIVIRFYLNRFQ